MIIFVHVIIGTIFLGVALWRIYAYHLTDNHHQGFEAGILYWHKNFLFDKVSWVFAIIKSIVICKWQLFSSNIFLYCLNSSRESSEEVTYENADTMKEIIYKENRGKTGVYRWTNLYNCKCYVGSSTNLAKRFTLYYSLTYLNKQASKSIICRALLKYGHSSFSLSILEYCDAAKAIEREQYYIDSLKPEYNILQTAGSTFGYRWNHSEETLAKLRGRTWKWTRKLTEEQKKNKSIVAKATLSEFNIRTKGMKVLVINLETNSTEEYSSIRSAATALDAHMETIRRCIKANKLYLNKYSIIIKEK